MLSKLELAVSVKRYKKKKKNVSELISHNNIIRVFCGCRKFSVPVLHAGEFSSGLLQGNVVPVREGAQAASNQSHRSKPCPCRAGRVRTRRVLLVRLAGARGLQPVIRTREGHLHDC